MRSESTRIPRSLTQWILKIRLSFDVRVRIVRQVRAAGIGGRAFGFCLAVFPFVEKMAKGKAIVLGSQRHGDFYKVLELGASAGLILL